ncbi:hypothetical protein BKA62DRAFT_687760 [Auriculariales sp. MPI-PUGE-AT-0066]|nr:hypothetical protein BKA62DRAFT_687760 [Auriculariales sp. MPI-PUGE-AT-0066]
MVTTRGQDKANQRPKRAPKPATASAPARPIPKRRKATLNATAKAKGNVKIAASKQTPNSRKTALTSRRSRGKATAARKSKAGKSTTENGETTVLEKGILYFFARPKVDVGDQPHSVNDIQRSFLVLRPLMDEDEETKVASPDAECRILVLPKKTMPNARRHDRVLTFVKSSPISVKDVSEQFMSSTYTTKTKGERTQPAAVPIAEAVYALVQAHGGSVTHLIYLLTVPEADKIDEVQKELGVVSQGSFVAQVRNPTFSAPPSAGVPNSAKFPEEIMNEFEGRRWGALHPKHLAYEHAEILLIGVHNDIEHEEGSAEEELEELKKEEEARVERLGEDEVVFKDLRLRRDEFKKNLDFAGTWG